MVLLSIAALILLAVIFVLPESYQPDPDFSLHPVSIVNNFLQVIKEPQFYTYAISGSIAFSGLFAYVSGAPLVFMDVFHLNNKEFGWVFAGLSVGFIGSSQVNSLLVRTHKSEHIIFVSLICQAIIGALFFVGAYNGWYGLYPTIAMIFLFLCCVGILNPNAAALSLAPFSKNAGSASALMGALQLGIGSLVSIAVSLFSSHSALPLSAIMLVSTLIALLILIIGRRHITAPVAAATSAVTAH
jgi:DHA1 family bicyclomycin/chloramphenicol resistance-like MFS transporter